MNTIYDETIRKRIQECKYNVPESYNEKFESTIKQIKNSVINDEEKINMPMILNRRLVRIAILLLALVLGSVSSYATISLYQHRMNEIPENIAKKYNDDVQQKPDIEVDAFSRPLTEAEKELMLQLRKQYEEEGRFPEYDIRQIDDSADVVSGELCFDSTESKFYLPERTMSEEELLEIIDLQEKRDYSIRQQNEQNEQNEENIFEENDNSEGITPNIMKEQSLELVAALFGVNVNELKYISSKQTDDTTEYDIQADDTIYSVYFSDNEIYSVMCTKENVSAHIVGINPEQIDIKSIIKEIKQQTEKFTNKAIKSQKVYSMTDGNGELISGTISMYSTMADGSGCVAVYSSSYKQLYHIYTVNDAGTLEEMIKEKRQNAKENGNTYTYKLVK